MRNVFRKSVAATLMAAALATPAAAATPVATEDCKIVLRDLSALLQDVSDCVNYILTITIIDPDAPARV